ncbi:MAG: GTPase Era [Epsilonproteobacteria bacterium]|nr:MAG: GTPase Era [Campylobacterota bacterium]
MLITHQHPLNRSIMVSVLGAPNVGKSSLINYLLGFDLTIVTKKAQTTRNRFHCVFTVDRTEIILVDTPGLHSSNKEFNKRLNQQAREGARYADLNLLLIDLTKPIMSQIEGLRKNITDELGPAWIVFTKSDLIENSGELPLSLVSDKVKEVFPSAERSFLISSETGDNIHELTGALVDRAPEGPHHYPDGETSNKSERFFVCEYIREQAFKYLKDELPFEVTVVIDEYKDLKDKGAASKIVSHISCSILVNRASQRAIVIGSKGSMIKKIGYEARRKIEAMVGGQIHLNLHVKVSPNWFKNNFILEEIGLPRAVDSNRVWRA